MSCVSVTLASTMPGCNLIASYVRLAKQAEVVSRLERLHWGSCHKHVTLQQAVESTAAAKNAECLIAKCKFVLQNTVTLCPDYTDITQDKLLHDAAGYRSLPI